MLPDLRLLIPATVATFFLAAILGLFASLRIAQEPPYVRSEQIAGVDDTPIARISASWPLPEPGRAAALRDLAKVVKLEPARNPVATDASPSAGEPSVPAIAAGADTAEPDAASKPREQVAATPPATATDAAPAPRTEPAEAAQQPQPVTATEGQRIASRPEPAERASEAEEPPAQAAPAEIVEPRAKRPRVVVRKRARPARRYNEDPFSYVPRPGFESPSNFSVYGRHTRSY